MFFWILGAIPLIITPILSITFLCRRAKSEPYNLGGTLIEIKIFFIIMSIISLIVVVYGSIYAYRRVREIDWKQYSRISSPFFQTTIESNNIDNKDDNLKEASKEEIIKYSIKILREHGKNDYEIKEELKSRFNIKDEVLDELMKTTI